MPKEEFEMLVESGFEQLPDWVKMKIKNVALLVQEEPTYEQLNSQGLDPAYETLLGLYIGVPLSARGVDYGVGVVLPDTIFLFQKPIEEAAAGNREKIKHIVVDTIWHEFAHHFGIDEDGVRQREEERGIGDYRI